MDNKNPKKISEKEIFKSKIFTIKSRILEFQNGKKGKFEIMTKGDSVMILPLINDGSLIFVREYFAAIDEYQLCFPKGRIEAGECASESANRELQEEVGLMSEKLTKLGELTLTPGYLSQKTTIFLAQDLKKSPLKGDELENLEIYEHSLEEFETLVQKGQLTEARAIAACFMARNFLNR